MKRVLIFIQTLSAVILAGGELSEIKAVLFPFREAVIAARIDSTLKPYQFKIGEKFAKESIIVQLDNRRYLIEQKRAAEQFNFAKANFEDKQELRAKNFTSDFELKKAQFDFKLAETALQDAELKLSFCTVKSPFAGKIGEILTREFETARIGQPLFKIIDDNALLAVLNVPMNNPNLTKPGIPLTFKLENGEMVQGKIFEVAPQADHRTNTIRIRVLIPNENGKYTAGMSGVLCYGK